MKRRMLIAIVLIFTACTHNVTVHNPSPGEIEEINQYHERLATVSGEKQKQ